MHKEAQQPVRAIPGYGYSDIEALYQARGGDSAAYPAEPTMTPRYSPDEIASMNSGVQTWGSRVVGDPARPGPVHNAFAKGYMSAGKALDWAGLHRAANYVRGGNGPNVSQQDLARQLKEQDYDALNNLQMYRNSLVHGAKQPFREIGRAWDTLTTTDPIESALVSADWDNSDANFKNEYDYLNKKIMDDTYSLGRNGNATGDISAKVLQTTGQIVGGGLATAGALRGAGAVGRVASPAIRGATAATARTAGNLAQRAAAPVAKFVRGSRAPAAFPSERMIGNSVVHAISEAGRSLSAPWQGAQAAARATKAHMPDLIRGAKTIPRAAARALPKAFDSFYYGSEGLGVAGDIAGGNYSDAAKRLGNVATYAGAAGLSRSALKPRYYDHGAKRALKAVGGIAAPVVAAVVEPFTPSTSVQANQQHPGHYAQQYQQR